MTVKRFDQSDLVYNTIKAQPRVTFDVYSGSVYYQNEREMSGSFTGSINCVPSGYVSLYEINVDRNTNDTGFIYPFVLKDSSLTSFKTMTTTAFFTASLGYGATISSSYPMSASVTREFVSGSTVLTHTDDFSLSTGTGSADWYRKARLHALKNTMNYNRYLSPHYAYSSSLGDFDDKNVNAIYIPSIFYGSSIMKGTVDLRYYSSGSLVGRLVDSRQNGELVEVTGTNTGSVAGVCLYNEGAILLTGSWAVLGTTTWVDFAEGANDGFVASSSIISQINFQGTSYTETLTMLAHAEKAEFNYSNNPTYISYDDITTYETGSAGSAPLYIETDRTIKNTVYSPYPDPTGSFEKITYISKIGVYDESKNLIGIATLATPVKKTEERDFTFKLKLDI